MEKTDDINSDKKKHKQKGKNYWNRTDDVTQLAHEALTN